MYYVGFINPMLDKQKLKHMYTFKNAANEKPVRKKKKSQKAARKKKSLSLKEQQKN